MTGEEWKREVIRRAAGAGALGPGQQRSLEREVDRQIREVHEFEL
jgi:hypothetical protein